jgi:menaquinone-dependent protoporphyrinogen oxidase
MNNKILILYGGNYDSTKEIAEYIGRIMSEMGGNVDVQSVDEHPHMTSYDAVIIGSAARMDKLLGKTIRYVRRREHEIRQKTTAYFVTCITMKSDTPENREKAMGFLQPLCQIKAPVGVGLFGGKLEYSKIGFLWKTLARQDKTGTMEEGDFRNWEKIETWAKEVGDQIIHNEL